MGVGRGALRGLSPRPTDALSYVLSSSCASVSLSVLMKVPVRVDQSPQLTTSSYLDCLFEDQIQLHSEDVNTNLGDTVQ